MLVFLCFALILFFRHVEWIYRASTQISKEGESGRPNCAAGMLLLLAASEKMMGKPVRISYNGAWGCQELGMYATKKTQWIASHVGFKWQVHRERDTQALWKSCHGIMGFDSGVWPQVWVFTVLPFCLALGSATHYIPSPFEILTLCRSIWGHGACFDFTAKHS